MSIHLGVPISIVVGTIEARPSRVIKTPYVCDMKLNERYTGNGKENYCLGHTPSLGCNGMVDKGATVIAVSRKRTSLDETDNTKGKRNGKCEYGVIASVITEKDITYVVGVDPSIAERISREILMTGVISGLCISKPERLQSQKTYNDCRFDYCGVTDDGSPFICEVKNVSIAKYEDLPPKQLLKKDYSERDVDTKVAVFPSGYKPKGQTHSERALKHTRTLKEIKEAHSDKMRCIILFVIQRDDVSSFQPSNGDEQYRKELCEAYNAGVEVYAIRVRWTYDDVTSQLTPSIVFDRQTHSVLVPIAFSQ